MQPEALSRWTPAVSTRCSWLASGASLSSSRLETDGRQVVASPREMRRLPGPVPDVPLLLPRADLLYAGEGGEALVFDALGNMFKGYLSDRAAFQFIGNKLTVAFEALKRL